MSNDLSTNYKFATIIVHPLGFSTKVMSFAPELETSPIKLVLSSYAGLEPDFSSFADICRHLKTRLARRQWVRIISAIG